MSRRLRNPVAPSGAHATTWCRKRVYSRLRKRHPGESWQVKSAWARGRYGQVVRVQFHTAERRAVRRFAEMRLGIAGDGMEYRFYDVRAKRWSVGRPPTRAEARREAALWEQETRATLLRAEEHRRLRLEESARAEQEWILTQSKSLQAVYRKGRLRETCVSDGRAWLAASMAATYA